MQRFSCILIIGLVMGQVTFCFRLIFSSLSSIYIVQIINSDFTDFKYSHPKGDLRQLLSQNVDLKFLFTLDNLPKSHVRELFVENDPNPSFWNLYSEIYVKKIIDFIKGTKGLQVKEEEKKEIKFAPGRAISGETLRLRKNNDSKNKLTKLWEVINDENGNKMEVAEKNKEEIGKLPDLLQTPKIQELKELEKKSKTEKVSFFSFESILSSWISRQEKDFDAVQWITKDFQAHVLTFSTLCKWIVAATKLDKYGIVVSQLPNLLSVLMDALEVLEKIDTEQTLAKKVKSTHVVSLIDGILVHKLTKVIKTGVYNIRIALGDEAHGIVRTLSGSAARFEKFIAYAE